MKMGVLKYVLNFSGGDAVSRNYWTGVPKAAAVSFCLVSDWFFLNFHR